MRKEMANYLKMRTDSDSGAAVSALLNSDMKDVGNAMKNLANHALGIGFLGFGTSFLEWIACAAAIYLLVLDRTNWKSNMLTSLLIPYIYLSLPGWLFTVLSGEIGKWIAFVAVVLRLFFPRHYPEWLDMPGSLVLLVVVAPSLISYYVKGTIVGIIICLAIGCYLLQEHIRASGGFRNSFTKSSGISNSVGILILFVYPVWALVLGFL